MFTNLEDALNYIENRRTKHSLDDFLHILDREKIDYDLPCIHVTGTNGKGGTINFLASILKEAGLKVGAFTSPYILCHQDRFTINGKMMPEKELLAFINQNFERIEKYNLGMFEIDVIIMLQYFKKENIDLALIEVGIGGRHDKTNMVHPKASIITNVGHDHLSQIGPTLQDVASEKAGIIKEGVPCFVGQMEERLIDIFRKEAILKHALFHEIKAEKNYQQVDVELTMMGTYHLKNACMAIDVIHTIYPEISDDIIKKGLLKATWPGRFERFTVGKSTLYLDGAHNLEAIQALLESVKQLELKATFIYAALQDKDYVAMAKLIKKEGYELEVCQFQDGRALNQGHIHQLQVSKVYLSIDDVICHLYNAEETYVVCGSLHFISQFRNKIIQK